MMDPTLHGIVVGQPQVSKLTIVDLNCLMTPQRGKGKHYDEETGLEALEKSLRTMDKPY